MERPAPPRSLRSTRAAHQAEAEDRLAKACEAGGPGGEAVAAAGAVAPRGSPGQAWAAQPCFLGSSPAASPGPPQPGRVAFGWAALSGAACCLQSLRVVTLPLF